MLRVKLWLGAVGAVLAAFVGAWLAGRREGQQEARTDALKGYAKTRKDIDDADEVVGSDPAVLRDWLRERGKP